jgi:serine protease Do
MHFGLPSMTRRLTRRTLMAAMPTGLLAHGMARAEAPPSPLAAMLARVRHAVVGVLVDRDRPLPDVLQPAARRLREGGTQASGFVVGPGGLIATNHHVVRAGRVLAVVAADGTVGAARLVGADPVTDLALLHAPLLASTPPLDFRATPPWLGETVVALGSPLGYGGSVSRGVVSGLERAYDDADPIGYLQHDAAINPGSSGGPLLDREGRVLGINTAIPDVSSHHVGIGFAIPAHLATAVVAELGRHGQVARGWLGLGVQALDTELASALGLPVLGGLLVTELRPGGPAKRSLLPGDVLLALDGRRLAHVRDMAGAMLHARAGQVVQVRLLRGGGDQLLLLVTSATPIEPTTAAPPGSGSPAAVPATDTITPPLGGATPPRASALGLVLAEAGAARGLAAGPPGIRVLGVLPKGLATLAGLRAGDDVLAVGRVPVATPAEAEAALSRLGAGPVALLVRRAGAPALYVTLPRDADETTPIPAPGRAGGPF